MEWDTNMSLPYFIDISYFTLTSLFSHSQQGLIHALLASDDRDCPSIFYGERTHFSGNIIIVHPLYCLFVATVYIWGKVHKKGDQ